MLLSIYTSRVFCTQEKNSLAYYNKDFKDDSVVFNAFASVLVESSICKDFNGHFIVRKILIYLRGK